MSNDQDIRWKQRFSNYEKALNKLSEAIAFFSEGSEKKEIDQNALKKDEVIDEILKEGLIQRFEYTHELAWNVMKDFLSEIGDVKVYGSKDATREAYGAGLISNGDAWMEMIKSRNKTSHTYNEETADEIFSKILNEYYPEFLLFQKTLKEKE